MGNILLSDKLQIKVADLGLAAKLDTEVEKRHTLCGTPNYVAPEVIDKDKYGGHSYESDVWSFGCILFAMLFGKAPFETDAIEKTYQRIKANIWEFPKLIKVSDHAKSIITSILVLDPKKRPSLDDLLNHDFFQYHRIPRSLPKDIFKKAPDDGFIEKYKSDLQPGYKKDRPQKLNL